MAVGCVWYSPGSDLAPKLDSAPGLTRPAPRRPPCPFAEGQWRPADATCDWFDISADPADVAAALAAALGRATPSAAAGCSRGGSAAAAAGVKTEPGLGDGKDGGGGSVGGAAAEEELVVRDSEAESEEEDEAEELRQAAAAVRRTSSAALEALAGQVRCYAAYWWGVWRIFGRVLAER